MPAAGTGSVLPSLVQLKPLSGHKLVGIDRVALDSGFEAAKDYHVVTVNDSGVVVAGSRN